MREVGRGQKVFEAAPVQGRVALLVDGGDPPGELPATAGTDGFVAVLEGVGPGALEPLRGSLAAIVSMDDEADEALVAASRELGVPCVLGVSFDGGPPTAGSLLLVDCLREEEGLVMVVDGGGTAVSDAEVDGVPGPRS